VPGHETTVARFELGEEIARGGMGAIFRVWDRTLDRELAVKVLLVDPNQGPQALLRFRAEAQITGQLQHPSIVPVHDFGTLADGRPFLAMKLIRGESLDRLLRQRPSVRDGLPRFLAIVEQVCQAVAYAHDQGVIHRDLKPLNVMVGAFGEVQVMDWGLAKRLRKGTAPAPEPEPEDDPAATVAWEGAPEAAEGTQAGAILGTPAYMPPEQARGEIELIDERADVFALGAMLCTVLTGQPPYVGKRGEVLRQTMAADLADASSRLDASGADAELIALTRRCLMPRREDRPRHAGEVAAALAAYQSGLQEKLRQADVERAAAQAREAEARQRARAERKARQRAIALAVIVLVLLIGGGAAGFVVYRQAAEKEAEHTRQQAEARVAVGAALDQAASWLKEGRARETEAALVQAEKRLDEAKEETLQHRLDRLRKDLDMVKALANTYSKGTTAADFRRAFQNHGLAVGTMDAAAIVQEVQGSFIREQLLDGLDGWLMGWRYPDTEATQRALLQVLRELDDDPVRNHIREALVKRDGARLRDLVMNADVAAWPAYFAAHVGGSGLLSYDDSMRLLKAVHISHPSFFVIPYTIAYRSWDAKPPHDDEAVAYLRVAIAIDPERPISWIMLGECLERMGDGPGATAAFRRSMECAADPAQWQSVIADALRSRRNLETAFAVARKAFTPDPKKPSVPSVPESKSRNNAAPSEALDLAELNRARMRYATAARFYASALATAPGLADDAGRLPRYWAARCAVLAADGQGLEAAAETERPKLRAQALQWLQAELDSWKTRLRQKPEEQRTAIQHRLRHWQQEADFASVRAASLKALPEAEATGWRKFWADVETVRQQAEAR
jgi:serine/threonine-protein kinase